MSNSIIVRFQPKGDKDLIRAIQALALAQARLEKNTKEVQKELARLGARGQLATKYLRNVNRETVSAGSAFSVFRSKLLLASFAFSLVNAGLLRFVQLTADAEEIESKFNVVFGDTAVLVSAWATTLGETVGRASIDLKSMASTIQDTFVPLGFARDASAKLSTQLVELALDVASFNNAADQDVLQAFQSALVGNHETVRRFGIVITEAALKEEAFKSGIITTNRELTNQEKVQARLNLLFDGSADAIGDLERTQGSFVNRTKQLNKAYSDLSRDLGEALLPIMNVVVFLTKEFLEAVDLEKIKSYGVAVGVIGGAWKSYIIYQMGATAALNSFKKAMIKTGIMALVVGLGFLIDKLNIFAGEVDNTEEDLKDLAKQLENLDASLTSTDEGAENFTETLKQMTAEEKQLVQQTKTLTSAFVNAAFAGEHLGRAVEASIKRIVAEFVTNQIVFAILGSLVPAPTLFGKKLGNLFGHQGGQVQGYATGGVVPSLGMMPTYHSGGTADNVPAMLQEGEFVMRRSAVESIGIENLNRMNRTGQAGGVNINFSGNVLSDSFIEEEAIPKIKKAVRRGADLGIA
tara:strand:+ start:5147 stop:6880 length:1734 start_codon:yes stop_codon:yes gene_type:complete